MTLESCETNPPDFWTKVSNWRNLNPLDFAVWSILERKGCSFKHKPLDLQKRTPEKTFGMENDRAHSQEFSQENGRCDPKEKSFCIFIVDDFSIKLGKVTEEEYRKVWIREPE
ncbi:hypothetical protein RB195_014624 [Necator americanus]|uniref:Uncharacterized protein n=1 Tax=Necator americanus TaxID=51031 RepID=A0ABR1E0V1_NECAM